MKVIINGAGLGGLSLAQGLKRANIDFRVFERDPTKDSRLQGYRLRINPDGSDALKKLLPSDLWTVFQRSSATTVSGHTRIDVITGEVKRGVPGMAQRGPVSGNPNEVYTADRSTLRSILLIGIEEHVEFGKEFVRYEKTENGLKAHYAGGHVEEGDILVGADGVYSRTRRQYLPDHDPIDTDVRAIYGKALITPDLLERFNKDATQGITVITDDKAVTLFLETTRFPEDPATVSHGALSSVQDYVYWVLLAETSRLPSDSELFSLTPQQTATLSLQITEGWHPSVRSLLEMQQSDRTSVVRLTSAPPDQPSWDSSNVTLLGDAIHCMPPTGGVGANTALRDAALLCELLKDKGVDGIREYESQMRDYSKQNIQGSLRAMKLAFGLSLDGARPLQYR